MIQKNLAKSKVVQKKVKQAKNGKLSPEEVQHLKRRGINIKDKPKSIETRFIRKITNWWETTPIERFLEDIDDFLQNSAFLSIAALLAQITIITSLIGWWVSLPEERENDIFATWQVVNDAEKDISGVVKIALERLLKNEFSLAGLNLQSTYLFRANLQEAELIGANLQEATLAEANFQRAALSVANFQEADLEGANLQGADLEGANFQDAILVGTNLQGAYLEATQNLTNEQIKSACFWEQTIYVGEYDVSNKVAIAAEPDNTDFIAKLKEDELSDPEEPIDCSRWENK